MPLFSEPGHLPVYFVCVHVVGAQPFLGLCFFDVLGYALVEVCLVQQVSMANTKLACFKLFLYRFIPPLHYVFFFLLVWSLPLDDIFAVAAWPCVVNYPLLDFLVKVHWFFASGDGDFLHYFGVAWCCIPCCFLLLCFSY